MKLEYINHISFKKEVVNEVTVGKLCMRIVRCSATMNFGHSVRLVNAYTPTCAGASLSTVLYP